MRTLTLLLLAAHVLTAQPNAKVEMLKRTDELEALITAGEWAKAVELSGSLKGAVTDARNRSLDANGSELADAILQWLPTDTQTLVVARQPFSLDKADPTEIPSALRMAQGYVTGLLSAAEKGKLAEALVGRTLRMSALAARHFANHPGDEKHGLPLGLIAYQGGAVYAFAESLPKSLLLRPADDSVVGHPVWISKGTQSDLQDSETYFVSLLKPDLITVCNSREFFQELALRLGLPQKSRALPPDLPEWNQVDRAAPLWAICHYSYDPSFVGLLGLARDGINPDATGIAVEFGLASAAARARMIAKSDPWKQLSASPDFHGAATSRQLPSGVWELSVSSDPAAGGMSALALMGMLGFIVLL